VADAKTLARHAHSAGADAMATAPPYYNLRADVGTRVQWLADVAAAAPDLPLW
jgi:N-acetylneuraminate lyase